MSKRRWSFVLWFLIASISDSILKTVQTLCPSRIKWMHFDALGFAIVLFIGIEIGKCGLWPWWEEKQK